MIEANYSDDTWYEATADRGAQRDALAGAAVFDLGQEEAIAIIAELRTIVAARWEPLFDEAGLGGADKGRFATCFRLASDDE